MESINQKQQFYRAYRAERICEKNGAGLNSGDEVLVRDPRTHELKIIRWGVNQPSFFTQLAASECLMRRCQNDKLAFRQPLQILRAQDVIKKDGKTPNLFGFITSANDVLATVRMNDWVKVNDCVA